MNHVQPLTVIDESVVASSAAVLPNIVTNTEVTDVVTATIILEEEKLVIAPLSASVACDQVVVADVFVSETNVV